MGTSDIHEKNNEKKNIRFNFNLKTFNACKSVSVVNLPFMHI